MRMAPRAGSFVRVFSSSAAAELDSDARGRSLLQLLESLIYFVPLGLRFEQIDDHQPRGETRGPGRVDRSQSLSIRDVIAGPSAPPTAPPTSAPSG